MSDALPPSPQSPKASSPSPPLDSEATVNDVPAPSVFAQTTQNLLKLGSLAMDKFAQDSSEELDGFDIPLVDPANPNAAGYYLGDTTATRHAGTEEEESDEIPDVPPTEAIRYLREVTQREFGTTSVDPLKYEFLEELGQNRKYCIFTITRPNGLSRSYRTKAEFARKSDAKVAAASSAIQLGAVRFIKHGEASKVVGKRSLVLAKLDAGAKKEESGVKTESKITKSEGKGDADEDDTAVAQIEQCCTEWRAGSVVPRWVYITEQKLPNAYGCALKVSLSPNIQRAYSVLVSLDYPNKSSAMAACARVALEQEVLEFIKHGDGLEHPILVPFVGAEALPPPPLPSITTLQVFHAALPKPMPDHIGTKGNGEINAVAWLNTLVQAAKGSRMTVTFTWHTDSKLGLHGCLLRLTRPDGAPSQSYLVDGIFSKRADAKLAVCLLACSQGVGDYVRGLAAEIDARVTAAMRRRCAEQILPALGQALNKVKHGTRPDFTFDCDLSTFGCTLTVDLSHDSETPVKKQWTVPMQYKSKADAKIAVACAAADNGVIEFVKYRGKTPPPGDGVTHNETERQASVELEEGETTMENVKKKKKKKTKRDATADEDVGEDAEITDGVKKGKKREMPLFETREEALVRGRFDSGSSKQQRQQQQQQKRNFGNGRGRGGGGVGRPAFRGGFGGNNVNTRGIASQSGFAADRPRAFGAPPGFSAPHPGVPPSTVPPFHPPPIYAAPYGAGYPGGGYGSEYAHHNQGPLYRDPADPGFAHGRHAHGPGGASADVVTPFAHAPPPAPPHVAPAYSGYEHERDYDYGREREREREYRQNLYAQPPFSGAVPHLPSHVPGHVPPGVPRPYGYEYPPAAPGLPPHPVHMAAQYSYEREGYASRPTPSAPRAYAQEHYAPDFDRNPDRSTAVREPPPAHEQAPLYHSASMHQGSSMPHASQSSPSHSHSPHSHSHSSVPSDHPLAHSQPHPHPQHQGYGSQPPYTEHPPQTSSQHARAVYDRPPHSPLEASQDDAMRGRSVYERVHVEEEQTHTVTLSSRPPRQPRLHAKPNLEAQTTMEEELNNVISRLEKEAYEKVAVDEPKTGGPQPPVRGTPNLRGRPSHLPSPMSGQKPSLPKGHKRPLRQRPAHDQKSAVPSKRGPSSDWEDRDSNKRKRERSRSISQPPEHERPREGTGRDKGEPPSGRQSADQDEAVPPPPPTEVATEKGVEKKSLKRAREPSSGGEKRKGSKQKDKSYVAALFDHCVKEGLTRPELFHEEIASDGAGTVFKVWIILGKERLELPTSFPALVSGQERVAKSVLGRLRVQTKKRKEA